MENSWTCAPEIVKMWGRYEALLKLFDSDRYGFNYEDNVEWLRLFRRYAVGNIGKYGRCLTYRYGKSSTLAMEAGDWKRTKYHIDQHNYPLPGACIYLNLVENDVVEVLRFHGLDICVRRSSQTLVLSDFFNT